MKFLRLFSAAIKAPALGRWQIHYEPIIVTLKVTQANEDHCGCCNLPVPPEEEYYMPFVTLE